MRINPYLNFKKEGEKIAYDELIYFENTKYHSVFSIPTDSTSLSLIAPTTATPPMLTFESKNSSVNANTSNANNNNTVEEEKLIAEYSSKTELNFVPTLE